MIYRGDGGVLSWRVLDSGTDQTRSGLNEDGGVVSWRLPDSGTDGARSGQNNDGGGNQGSNEDGEVVTSLALAR